MAVGLLEAVGPRRVGRPADGETYSEQALRASAGFGACSRVGSKGHPV